MIADFLTEDKVRQILSSGLPAGEELEFVGHAFSHLWGFMYYAGKSQNFGVTAKLFNGCHIEQPAIMPMTLFEELIGKKKIEIFPFEMPPFRDEKDRVAFLDMKESIENYSEPGEEFVTLCRASKGIKNFLIGITDKRILIFKIKPKVRLEIIGLESSIPLSDIEEVAIPFGPFGAELLPIRVPLIDSGRVLRISLKDGKAAKYSIAGFSLSYGQKVC